MDWMVPLRRLDEEQRNVLRKCSSLVDQPIWIEGFAGSGKTVLLVHAIQNYMVTNPNSKVCIVVFTHALIDLIKTGIAPEFREKITVMTYFQAVNRDRNRYDLIVVDEVQDIPPEILSTLRNKTNRLLIGGDDAQSIYESGSSEAQIEALLQPDRLKLPKVYRLTRKIINIVKNILPNNTLVTATSGRMEEIQVTLARAENEETEFTWVWQQAKRFTETGHPSVIILPNHEATNQFMRFVAMVESVPPLTFYLNQYKKTDYGYLNEYFKKHNLEVGIQYLGSRYGSLKDSGSMPIVYVMTYHSVKGLDFRSVFLPLLNQDTLFWRRPDIDRRLFFVGATRSRRDLFLSYHSPVPHLYIQEMPQDELHKVVINLKEDDEEDDFIF